MNLRQRALIVAAAVMALWGLAHALVPFTVSPFFGATLSCSAPIVAFDDEEQDFSEDVVPSDFDQEDLDSCRDGARRRLMRSLLLIAFPAIAMVVGIRLLADPPVEPVAAEDPEAAGSGDESRPPSAGSDLPPYATDH